MRVNLDSVRASSPTMIQTEKYGTPLASALRVLSSEFRNERMMRAEEKAARLPAIMTVPLILFISLYYSLSSSAGGLLDLRRNGHKVLTEMGGGNAAPCHRFCLRNKEATTWDSRNQWAILALILILGWLLGLLSRSGGARWRRIAAEEQARRETAKRGLTAANEYIADLDRQTAGRPMGPGTAAAIGAAASGACDDLALYPRHWPRARNPSHELGIHSYQKVAALSDGEAIDLETRLGLSPETIAREQLA